MQKSTQLSLLHAKTAEGLEGVWASTIRLGGTDFTRSNNSLREQTLSQWKYLWDKQKPIRTWPTAADITTRLS